MIKKGAFKLSKYEQSIEDAAARGEFVPVPPEEFNRIVAMLARRRKDAVLNIRINSQDLANIKAKARKKGIPYQALISEVLHRLAQ